MTTSRFVLRSLRHYWRTNLAVVLGVAAAVTVLSGALLVGDSVRGSLSDLVLQRIGQTNLVVASSSFFRSALAEAISDDKDFHATFQDLVPLVALPGVATEQASGQRASQIQVYGVDEHFWAFHGMAQVQEVGPRDVLLSPALAREIGAAVTSAVLLRVQRPSDIPLESLHGRRDDLGRTIRLTVRSILSADELGEFSLQPRQGEVLAAFVPLARLQQDLELDDTVNTLLVSTRASDSAEGTEPSGSVGSLEALVRRHARLEDLGMTVRVLEEQDTLSLESPGTLLDEVRVNAALEAGRSLGLEARPVLTYLVNAMRHGDKTIPYSLVTALALETLGPDLELEEPPLPPIVLNEWAARELAAVRNDHVTLEYYAWEDPGRLVTRTAEFIVSGIVPLAGPAADRTLAPDYPGITDSVTLSDWDPPFPIDLRAIRPVDEEYWDTYRTTPKAFVPEQLGAALWRSRYGSFTSIRFTTPSSSTSLEEARHQFETQLLASIDPMTFGLAVRDVRSSGLLASRGATDFGEYFTYFSFFLVVSALVLAALFFKLGVEQRGREVGLLRAIGFPAAALRRLFTVEAFVLSLTGSVIGVVGALGYGWLMMAGLRTWWVDAVGTTALTLHVSPVSLVGGALGGILAAICCIWLTLRSLEKLTERSLLAGQISFEPQFDDGRTPARGRSLEAAAALAVIGLLLVLAGLGGWIARAGAFFGAGGALLTGALLGLRAWLGRRPRGILAGHGWRSVARVGVRNAGYRPARSVLAVAVMASATFILISVDTFRQEGQVDATNPESGAGGYSLFVETVLPIADDPNSAAGRSLLGLASTPEVQVTPFRVLPGDDASCLNLYEPRQPRILGATHQFVTEGHFAFGGSLDRNDEERENPWLLLESEDREGAVPVIADANSMTYILHRSLGDEITFMHGGREVRLRIVAALTDSLFQSELVMSEANFRRLFPDQEGYGFLLIDAPPSQMATVSSAIENSLVDFGADARSTADRIAEFHRVENTYLSTFQTLGGLGLLLGTVGLAAVLLRNVLERRRELALLGAVGYSRSRLFLIIVTESALVLTSGLLVGTVCALVAVAPAAIDQGGTLPTTAGSWLTLFAVFGVGLIASLAAARAATRTSLLGALRAE